MFQIIPAIDIINGKCVRLTKGDYATQKIYNENPLEVALQFEDSGIKQLHLVDLDGAKEKSIQNHKVLDQIASNTKLKIDFGGGVQSNEDLQKAFDHGAHQVTGGSVAVKNPQLFLEWIDKWGGDKIILGADAKEEKIAISGWEESSDWDIIDFLHFFTEKGIKYIISTDVAKDGLLEGPSFDLYEKISGTFPQLKTIASGGVSKMEDILLLAEKPLYGVIVGKAIYENRISLAEIESFNLSNS